MAMNCLPDSVAINWPRCRVTRKLFPSNVCAAVAPRQTMSFGRTRSNSTSSQGRHAWISLALGFWCKVLTGFGFPFEVFHHIGDVSLASIDARLDQRFVQNLSGRPHKGLPHSIFFETRLFPYKKYAGFSRSFSENSLNRASPKRTRPAGARCHPKFFQRRPWRN